MLTLPLELEREFEVEVEKLEEFTRMKYVTSFERNARRESLLEGIEVSLEVKFGSEGLNLLPEISQIYDIERLRAILVRIKTANSLSELRQIYQSTTSE